MTDTSAITDVNATDVTNGNDQPEKFDLASWVAGFQPTPESLRPVRGALTSSP